MKLKWIMWLGVILFVLFLIGCAAASIYLCMIGNWVAAALMVAIIILVVLCLRC